MLVTVPSAAVTVATGGCARLKVVAASTLWALLEQAESDHPALVVPNGVSLSYRRLRELVDEAAHALAAQGAGRPTRVITGAVNSW